VHTRVFLELATSAFSGQLRKPLNIVGQKGTVRVQRRFRLMTEPLPALAESSLQIAWDFLDGVGELADPQQTAEFLLRNIQSQMLKGERRALVLSNRAINSYRQRQKPVFVS
jgi:hypothetical protein